MSGRSATGAPERFKVLHVEDSLTARKAVADVVRSIDRQCSITVAGCEAEAVAHLRSAHWDMVIVDLQLEAGQGFNVLQACGASDQGTAAVVFSDYAGEHVAELCTRAGAAAAFRKTQLADLRSFLRRQIRAAAPPSTQWLFGRRVRPSAPEVHAPPN